MSRALLTLIALDARGAVLRRARLLRRPRYLLAFLFALLYFGSLYVSRLRPGAHPPALPLGGGTGEVLALAAGLIAVAALTLAWLLVGDKPLLRLSETEIHFLLPAPLTRREVLAYALLRRQPRLLASALIFFLFRGRYAATGHTLPQFVALWALLTLVDLHLTAVSLWKARLAELPPAAAALRRGLAMAVAAAGWAAVLWAARDAWQSAAAGSGFPAFVRAAHGGLLGRLLTPSLWIASPFVPSLVSPWRTLPLLLLLVAAHAEWVIRSRASFEDAAVERARRELARGAGRRRELPGLRARTRQPFRLAAVGRPEMVIAWKNLMLRGRTPLATFGWLLLAATAVLTAVAALGGAPAAGALAGIGGFLLCVFPVLAGLVLRNDLRSDLLQVEVLRAWPIAGRNLVLGELLAPAIGALLAQLTGAALVVAAAAGSALRADHGALALFSPALPGGAPLGVALPVVLLSVLLAGAALASLSIAIQNLAALLLPGWVGLGLDARRGSSVLGQQLLVGIGHLLALLIALLPTFLVLALVAGCHLLLDLPFHLWELPLLAVAVALLLLSKVWLVAGLAGTVWDRMDPSREVLEAAG